jgi:aminoglycoside 3-N-acetyltransferase
MDAGQPAVVTRAEIARGLRDLGVREGDVILVHSSLKSFGRVEGGAEAVIAAMVPTLTGRREDSPECPPRFDVRQTRCWTGLIPETFRQRPNSVRSLHPTHSVAAIGPLAAELTRGHLECETPCGSGSPYLQLAERGGKVVFLGVTLDCCTLLHGVEELAQAEYHLQPEPALATVTDAQGREFQHAVRLHSWSTPRRFTVVEPLFLRRGILRLGRIGRAEVRVLEAGPAVACALELLRRQPRALCVDGGPLTALDDEEKAMDATQRKTVLEELRDTLGLRAQTPHEPQWRIEEVDGRFTWIHDGSRGVVLVDRRDHSLELRCAGPAECPAAVVPRHYHVATQEGVRILYEWRLGGKAGGKTVSVTDSVTLEDGQPVVRVMRRWSDGTESATTLRLRFDAAWGAYVVDARAELRARRVTTALEYCNVLPAGVGDSRPGRELYPYTFWAHPDGLRKMLKNPLWFVSAGAQDEAGEKRIAPGGFIGYGPAERMNPVVEIVSSDPGTGATTCDNLQDEHIMALPAEGRHAARTGWFELQAEYRLFSIPAALAQHIAERATLMRPGAMLAWKFQYPPTPELPLDLARVELPGSPFYGASDWSRPIPWDEPYNGRLWTASPDPAAAIHYDRVVGRGKPGSIRLRPAGERLEFAPGSGHSLRIEEGVRYRYSAWIRTAGPVRACIRGCDLLFRCGDGRSFESAVVGPDSNWRRVSVEFTGRGDDAPHAETILCAEGEGEAWFTDLAFEPV